MIIVNASQMRQIDQQTIQEVGIPALVLMENAGRKMVEVIQQQLPRERNFGVIIGKGNNGGDGLVIARYLAHLGRTVTVYLVSGAHDFTSSAQVNFKIVQNLGLPIVDIMRTLPVFDHDVLVDAIFGIGLSRPIEGHIAKVIQTINKSNAKIVSIDVPSGLNTDTGQPLGETVKANLTITVGLNKIGLVVEPGATLAGQVRVVDIGFPSAVIEQQKISTYKTHLTDLLFPTRSANSHKGKFGRVFVLAGSAGMTGAATLTSSAVLKSGAGLVTVGIPQSLNNIISVKLTEAMTLPLPDTETGSLNLSAEPAICAHINQKETIVAIGPGLSQNPKTVALIHQLVHSLNQPLVIDADGLNALAKSVDSLSILSSANNRQLVITPHLGEMSRLIDRPISFIIEDPIAVATEFARYHQLTVVLKSVPVTIASPDGQVWLNSTGNSGLATAGSGDVLTGVIAGFMAQGLTATQSAVTSVYLHGLAGDLAAERLGEHSLMATDILNELPKAIKETIRNQEQQNTS